MSTTDVRLNEHVLYLVAEKIVQYFSWGLYTERKTLFNLRMTSKEFASMGIIKAALFREVKFYATQDQISRLHQTNFASFGPFVKTATFIPSSYCTEVNLEAFKDILLVQCAHMADPRSDDFTDDALLGAKNTMNKRWGGRFPKPDREVRASFKIYQDFARDDEFMIVDGQLQKLWISALATFQNIEQINISSLECFPHLPGPRTPFYRCDGYLRFHGRMAARSGDNLFKAVAQCLTATRTRPKVFLIDCPLKRPLFDGWKNSWWDKVDLGQTTRIRIEEDSGSDGDRGSGALWTSLLKKAQTSVQEIRIGNPSEWPDMVMASFSGLSFPLLRLLCFESVKLGTTTLGATLQRSPALEELTLNRCLPATDTENWKPLFDAIRKHTSPLKVDFLDIYDGKNEWTFRFRKDKVGMSTMLPGWSGFADDDLILYLCNKGPWTQTLDEWLLEW